MKLYIYDHCPFCVRSRMIFGLKDVACEVITLPNDDEETPMRLIGKKMLPVLVTESHDAIGESLDIVKYVDETCATPVLTVSDDPAIEIWMEEVTNVIFPLAIPRWASSDFEEFRQDAARQYFVQKKEAVFGPFPRLLEQTEMMITEINAKLEILDDLLVRQEKMTGYFSLTDIRLFPLLRSLSIVKGICWPPRVHEWLKEMAVKSRVNINDNIAV
ncbi:GrxB family glutaredoxin [Enterobacter cloacae]|uniref:glutaredoxin 2 n=1 Tax=Enterobacter cloacae TaxID=550 RepID=UPI000A3D54DA|nr:glutaredoxin 2 [Enterobacter cloacae]OUF39375.1 GrxB family glutaredoxin [Enterobacter cloacae]